MSKLRDMARIVLSPPTWFRWTFAVLSIACVLSVFAFGLDGHNLAYVVYAASALGLYYALSVVIPAIGSAAVRLLESNRLTRRLLQDMRVRSRAGLYGSAVLDVLFTLFNLVSGAAFGSTWLVAIGVYYLTLTAVRSSLVVEDVMRMRDSERGAVSQWRAFRRAGALMLLMSIGLAAIIAHVIARGTSFEYPGPMIYAMAAWAFYYIANAIVRLVRDRTWADPVLLAARAINLSFAVTSMFTLQTAMFASFSQGLDVRNPNFITGAAAAAIVVLIAVAMVVHGNRRVRDLEDKEGA